MYSIIIPTKDRPALLRRAVKSALAATESGGTVIVVDDSSTPPAGEALADLACGRLRVERNPGHRGAAAARNFGAATSKAGLLFFLDDDDELLPGYVPDIMRYYTTAGAARFGCSMAIREGSGAPYKRSRLALQTGVLDGRSGFRSRLCGAGEGFWIDREVFLSLGGFDTGLKVDEDTDFCVRLFLAGYSPYYTARPGVRIGSPGAGSAQNAPSLSSSTPLTVMQECMRRTYEKSAGQLPVWQGGGRWHLATRYLRMMLRGGQAAPAIGYALRQRPVLFGAALAAYCSSKAAAGLFKRRPANARNLATGKEFQQ